MLRFIVFILSLAFFAGCDAKPEREVLEQWSAEQPKLVGYYVEEEGQRIKVKEEQFYEDGTKEYVGGFDADGRREGEWRYYYNNGQLWSIGSYISGSKEGRKEVYWPDGTRRYTGQFKNDEKAGTWIFYNPNGTLLQRINFDADQGESKK